MAVAPSPGVSTDEAAAVQNIQKFSFKGYDQQPPGFSKPGFLLFFALRGYLEINPRRKTANNGPSGSGPVVRFCFRPVGLSGN